jgi:hypothetical protein
MSDKNLTAKSAQWMEFWIIWLGIVALIMIFQPFSLQMFTIGAIIVVIAGLINNLLPMARPGVKVRSVITTAMVVAMIFCITLLVAIVAANLYGVFFLKPPVEGTQAAKLMANATKWYAHPFTLSVAAVAVVLAALIWLRTKRG